MNTLKRGFDSLFFPPDLPTIAETDEEAIASDWKAVGDDMRYALRTYGEEVSKEKEQSEK